MGASSVAASMWRTGRQAAAEVGIHIGAADANLRKCMGIVATVASAVHGSCSDWVGSGR
jgi:hypothetical protein